jgi:hypothetical protein
VSQKANIIEINGKRYDALSGQLLGDASSAIVTKPVARRSGGVSMDGFISQKSKTLTPATTVVAPLVTSTVVQPSIPAAKLQPFADIAYRVPAASVPRHKTTPSKTLMRHAVSKPAPSFKRHAKVQQRADILVKQPSITVKPKFSSYQLDPKRVMRAKQTQRHPEANRYAQPRPVLAAMTSPAATLSASPRQATIAKMNQQPTQPKQTAQGRAADIFEQALARANSHKEKPGVRRHTKHRHAFFGPRALSFSSAAFALLLIVGFFAWQQKASLTMRYAAAKSGVSASLPGYKPAGFSAGKFSYSPGVVAVSFSNAASGDSFALIERSSSWDSQALRDSFVASKSRTYQTIDAAGRTIYSYGSNNATWVDNGVWYQVNSQGSLSTNQLVQLALSM